jgi:hypothetical protein
MEKADTLEGKDCDTDGLHRVSSNDGYKLAQFYPRMSFGPMVQNRADPQN